MIDGFISVTHSLHLLFCCVLSIIIIIIIISFTSFHDSVSWWSFTWSMGESKPSQVTKTLLSILDVFSNSEVWMVPARPPISSCSNPFSSPSGIVPSAPVINGITVTSMFHRFFCSLARFKDKSLFSFSLIFTLWSDGTAKSTRWQVLFFFFFV